MRDTGYPRKSWKIQPFSYSKTLPNNNEFYFSQPRGLRLSEPMRELGSFVLATSLKIKRNQKYIKILWCIPILRNSTVLTLLSREDSILNYQKKVVW